MHYLLCPLFFVNHTAHPIPMSEAPEIWSCPHCHMQQDVAALGFYAEVRCPQCGTAGYVHALIANYKVDAVLGIGGMGVVFQAQDLVLGRPLAIKVLNDTYRDAPERIASFENECMLMAKVRHENVVSVYSAGWARGQFYIAMELVDGRNLELIVKERGFLLPTDALEIVRQVALGLQAAHAAGLLHRDVKPGNVLITQEGQAKVLDFGLSLEDAQGTSTEEIIWATPYYVPPETLRRETENVQTDIYALGMTLRNLLTGEDKLPGEPQTLADMLVSKKTLARMESLAPHLEPELCRLVDVMTAYSPADRPAGYDDLLEQIARVQQTLVLAASPEERARRRRHKWLLAAGALGTVAAGLIGAFIVALLSPSAVIREAVAAEIVQWQELDTYRDAEQSLMKGDFARAEKLYASLSSSETEPTLALSATLMRTLQDVVTGRNSKAGLERFITISEASGMVAPAGSGTYDKLLAFVEALQEDTIQANERAGELENRMLRFAAMVLLADKYAQLGDREGADERLDAATALIDEYDAEALSEKLDEYRMQLPRRLKKMALSRLKENLRAGRLNDARMMVGNLMQQKLGRLEREEIRVLDEAAALMQMVHAAMTRKGITARLADCTPAELAVHARALQGKKEFPDEVRCLALMLRGDYAAAFKADPYAKAPDSNEPFAVIMRDWKVRLEQ